MSLDEAIKKCKKIVATKFNNDYSIDNEDREAINVVLENLETERNINFNLSSEIMSIKMYVDTLKNELESK